MWTDGLDSPVVRYLEILAMEPRAKAVETASTDSLAGRTLHYRWDDAHRDLLRRADDTASPFDDVIMEYRDPVSGASVLPTIGCYLQMLRPGVETKTHRQTSSAVYHVVRGSGSTMIGHDCHHWDVGDFFVVPPNVPHSHRHRGTEPAILFSMQDVPLLKALGLYYES